MLVGIIDHHGQRGTGGLALKEPGEHLHPVRLFPGGGGWVLPRTPPVQFPLDPFQIQFQAGRHALQHHADGGAMGFAKNHVPHVSFPPKLR